MPMQGWYSNNTKSGSIYVQSMNMLLFDGFDKNNFSKASKRLANVYFNETYKGFKSNNYSGTLIQKFYPLNKEK